jgi:ectoine hydroxylase-related dioxygenase (phytanoyl-CoA dioxygenase family)
MSDLPQPTRDLETAKADLDRFGYCLLAEALSQGQVAALRARLEEQAQAEREAGVGYFDGAPDQNWGAFRDADGRLRSDAFSEAAGVNQRVWMLVNKGQVFVDLLTHPARELIGHLLGEHYILSSYTANIANPGGVAMKLHTDQWWMPSPTRRERKPLPIGSMRRDRFDQDSVEPSMISPVAACNIMWMLDDFTEENGATRIVPGSHLKGRQPDPVRDADTPTIGAVGPAGSAMVFDGRLWHGTGANTSNRRRMGLLTTFNGPQLRPQENFTVGTRAEVLEHASPDLLELLGFRVWSGYGRTGNPVVDFIDPNEVPIGTMTPYQA